MARCNSDRDPAMEENGVFPYPENCWPLPHDDSLYGQTAWRPPRSDQSDPGPQHPRQTGKRC
eukprot:3336564-Lingulodinium_polyedra.AAC.1